MVTFTGKNPDTDYKSLITLQADRATNPMPALS